MELAERVIRGPIPACAGEPSNEHNAWKSYWAYPRMRGGTELAITVVLLAQGLSPHARGNPAGYGLTVAALGPIPACAGEPRVESD